MDAGRRLFVSALQVVRERQGEETQCLAQLSVRIAVSGWPNKSALDACAGFTKREAGTAPGNERRMPQLACNDVRGLGIAPSLRDTRRIHLASGWRVQNKPLFSSANSRLRPRKS